MKNSIEEDIKNAEHFIKSIKTDKEYEEENGWHGYYNKEIVELARMLENILSNYKRLLKENEELNSKIPNLEQGTEILMETNTKLTIELNDSISKKKIKNKIEELSKTKGDLATHIAVSERIRALQELLESEDSKDGEN